VPLFRPIIKTIWCLHKCPCNAFTCGWCIFSEGKVRIVNDVGMGLILHSPNINIILTFQNKLNDISVCNQPVFVHIHCHKSLDNLILYELTLFHLHLVHIMSCHNRNELSHQTINVTSLEAFCFEKEPTFQCPMVRFCHMHENNEDYKIF